MAARKPRRGPIPKLDAAVSKAVCEAVAANVPLKYAAQRAGVSERSVMRWLAAGRAAKSGPYKAFVAAVKKAEADAVAFNVTMIRRAASERDVVTVKETKRPDGTVERVTTTKREFDWCAAAWLLERRHPKDFGRATPREKAGEVKASPPPLVVGGEASPELL